MAWIEWHHSIRHHHKTDKLASLLKIEPYAALGLRGALYAWAIDERPGGVFERDLVAIACRWAGDLQQLVVALLESKLIDPYGDDKVRIHDWPAYTCHYRKAKKDATRKASEYRAKHPKVSAESPRKIHGDSMESRGDLTRPDLTRQDMTGQGVPAREVEAKPPQLRSGTVEHQLAAEWNNGPGFPISPDKAARLIRCTLDAGADAQKLQTDIWTEAKTKGRKIWQLLEEHIPRQSERAMTELMAWAKKFDANGGNNGAHR